MSSEDINWSYNEFLAFILVYSAGMNHQLSKEELEFIKSKTGIQDIDKIKVRVESLSDVEAIEVMDRYKKEYLPTPEKLETTKRHLEGLLKTDGVHSQLEKVVVHLMEKLI
jgi:hypothetical protein